MSGWIKLHRSMLDWEWWEDHNTTRLFIWMLMKANHKPKRWRGISIDAGQFVSGRQVISDATGISERSVRTSINKLKATGELTTKTTNRFTVYTLENWGKYQIDDEEATSQLTSQASLKRPATDQQPTTNKNDKKEKKEKKSFQPPTFDELKAYCESKGFGHIAQKAYDYYSVGNWTDGNGKQIKSWKRKLISVWFDEEKNPKPKTMQSLFGGMENPDAVRKALDVQGDVAGVESTRTGKAGAGLADSLARKLAGGLPEANEDDNNTVEGA